MPNVRCKPDSAPCSAQPAEPHHEAAEPTTLWQVDRLAACLREAADSLQRAQVECARVNGMTESRFRVLQALADHGGPECTQADLAGKLHQSESYLSALVEQLAMEGLLCRERSRRDRRKTLLQATTEGRRLAQTVARERSRMLNQLLGSWTVEQLREALASLRRLTADLDGWSTLMSRVNHSPVGTGEDAVALSTSNAR